MGNELRYNEPLSRYTSWRVGGMAKCLYRPADQTSLVAFLTNLPSAEPILWLGYGSNVLIRDGGFLGTVILLRGTLGTIEHNDQGRIKAQAGVGCARLAHFAAKAGLTGAEFLAGIPGSLGGGLALNAGAHGGEIWRLIHSVLTVDRTGIVHMRTPNDYKIGYREIQKPAAEWFLEATLILESGSIDAIQKRMREYLQQRAATQPIGWPSAGSTFRNPPGDHAGRLIEAAGLKGLRQGGAEVSTKHANFIVNVGNATATDIETLIARIQIEVNKRFGVELIPEVQIVGCKL